jgi:hypothetical protein
MADATPEVGGPAPKRGEAAWKAEKERIAQRNQEARKAGKAARREHESRMAERRRDADLRDIAGALHKGTAG